MNCLYCKNTFKSNYGHQRYCSSICRRMFQKKSYYELNAPAGIPTSTTGAIKELLVSADLLSKKYHVFRSVSPNCPCDLIVMKDKRLFRIEVKTTYRNKDGSVWWPNKKDSHKRDIVALVTKEGQISYLPEIDKWGELSVA